MTKLKLTVRQIVLFIVMAIILAALIVADVMCARYASVITTMLVGTSTNFNTDEAKEAFEGSEQVIQQINDEGIVLLKNDGLLPLQPDTSGKINVNLFGWTASDEGYMYTHGGSGKATINAEKRVSLSQGLQAEGISVNTELLSAYADIRTDRNWSGFNMVEPPVTFYDKTGANGKTLLQNAKDFSDTAIIVLGRFSSEQYEMPLEQAKYFSSSNTPTVDSTRHYFNTSTEEDALIELVSNNFSKIIVLFNMSNPLESGFLENEKIGAALFAGHPGQSGTKAIGRILKGDVNPSGKLTDTHVYDQTLVPSYANKIRNADHVAYTEDIYIGYKWFETADKEGFYNDYQSQYGEGYNGVVHYPFGYGLSYTTFTQEIVGYEVSTANDQLVRATEIKVTVSVKNTGNKAGKDVIQLYYTPPYIKGGIEKAHVNLVNFTKTEMLEPNESKEYTLSFRAYDMASYDAYDKNKNGFRGYELESGAYKIQLLDNAHEWATMTETDKNTVTLEAPTTIAYNRDPDTGAMVKNRFGMFEENGQYIADSAYTDVPIDGSTAGEPIQWLSRNNFKQTFPTTQTPNRNITSVLTKAAGYVELNVYADVQKPAMETIGEKELLLLTKEDGTKATKAELESREGLVYNKELISALGSDYNSPLWDQLLNQLNESELTDIVESSGYGTDPVESIGKMTMYDYDGPSGFNLSVNRPLGDKRSEWSGFPNETLLGQTWNKDLAYMFGQAYGKEGVATGISGAYAPGVNLHRTAFNGRNAEYYAEDGVLSGFMASEVIQGSMKEGMYMYLKHFAVSEMGANPKFLNTWITEQNLRENYLKPFEICVKNGANAIMSAFNRLGGTWTGGNYALCTLILRNEWKFKGVVITDWSEGGAGMGVHQGLHAGNDIWLNPSDRAVNGGLDDSLNSSWYCARRSAKNLLYTICSTYNTAWNSGTDVIITENEGVFAWWIPVLVAINVLTVGAMAFSVFMMFRKKKTEVVN